MFSITASVLLSTKLSCEYYSYVNEYKEKEKEYGDELEKHRRNSSEIVKNYLAELNKKIKPPTLPPQPEKPESSSFWNKRRVAQAVAIVGLSSLAVFNYISNSSPR